MIPVLALMFLISAPSHKTKLERPTDEWAWEDCVQEGYPIYECLGPRQIYDVGLEYRDKWLECELSNRTLSLLPLAPVETASKAKEYPVASEEKAKEKASSNTAMQAAWVIVFMGLGLMIVRYRRIENEISRLKTRCAELDLRVATENVRATRIEIELEKALGKDNT